MVHRSQFGVGCVAFLLLNLGPIQAQQAIERPAVSSTEGIVINLGTGGPLAEAEVELSRVDEGVSFTATTGADGRFAFENVPPGDYRLVSTHSGGFMPAEYGQRSPTGRGIVLAWENVDFGAWQDPDFVRFYEGRGRQIRIDEGAAENIRVTVFQ